MLLHNFCPLIDNVLISRISTVHTTFTYIKQEIRVAEGRNIRTKKINILNSKVNQKLLLSPVVVLFAESCSNHKIERLNLRYRDNYSEIARLHAYDSNWRLLVEENQKYRNSSMPTFKETTSSPTSKLSALSASLKSNFLLNIRDLQQLSWYLFRPYDALYINNNINDIMHNFCKWFETFAQTLYIGILAVQPYVSCLFGLEIIHLSFDYFTTAFALPPSLLTIMIENWTPLLLLFPSN